MARRTVRYLDHDFVEREGEVVERNGTLLWVVDPTTGRGQWIDDCQIIRE